MWAPEKFSAVFKLLTKTEKALNVWLEDISQKYISVDDKIMPEKAL